MEAAGLSHLIVSSVPNLLYLTERRIDTGERLTVLLLSGQSAPPRLYVHEMFANLVEGVEGIECVAWSDHEDPIELVARAIRGAKATRPVGIDATWMSGFLLDLQRLCPDMQTIPSLVVEQMREIKDDFEIDLLRRSSRIADAVMHEIIRVPQFPMTETQTSELVRQFFAEHQVARFAFPPIVGFGPHSADPHCVPGEASTRPGDALLIDIGGIYRDYCSDITRNAYYGQPDKRVESAYEVLRHAHEDALSRIRPGMTFSELDTSIRAALAQDGYERHFIHRTGHGLGLEPHERPSIHKSNHDTMREGMVFTVEPGIYFPGKFGLRIEDVVVVTASGCEVLTRSPRDIQYVDAPAS